MARVIDVLPEITGEEMLYIQSIIKDMDDDKARTFAGVYRVRRKSPQLILITALLGLIGAAGVHRFFMDQIGMGILYFFTVGLCFIGTIMDLVNYQKLAFETNQKTATEVLSMLR